MTVHAVRSRRCPDYYWGLPPRRREWGASTPSPVFLLTDGTGGEGATCALLADLTRPCFVSRDTQAKPALPACLLRVS